MFNCAVSSAEIVREVMDLCDLARTGPYFGTSFGIMGRNFGAATKSAFWWRRRQITAPETLQIDELRRGMSEF